MYREYTKVIFSKKCLSPTKIGPISYGRTKLMSLDATMFGKSPKANKEKACHFSKEWNPNSPGIGLLVSQLPFSPSQCSPSGVGQNPHRLHLRKMRENIRETNVALEKILMIILVVLTGYS